VVKKDKRAKRGKKKLSFTCPKCGCGLSVEVEKGDGGELVYTYLCEHGDCDYCRVERDQDGGL